MASFIISTVVISDPVKFKAYLDVIAGLSEKFGGEYVIRGAVREGLEGDVKEGERIVVLKFPDTASAKDFYNSETYQKGKALRVGAAEVTMRLVEA